MIRAYHKLGNRVQVLRTYQRCVANLDHELGVEPAPLTVRMVQDLSDGKPR